MIRRLCFKNLILSACLILSNVLFADDKLSDIGPEQADPVTVTKLLDECVQNFEEDQKQVCANNVCESDDLKEGCDEAAEVNPFCDDLVETCFSETSVETDFNPAGGLKLLEAACKANPSACDEN